MRMRNGISIIGAGGHSRVIINVLDANSYIIDGIFDDSYQKGSCELINSYKIIGKIVDISNDCLLVVAIGDNALREYYYKLYLSNVLSDNLIHPKAKIESNCNIRRSNQFLANTYIAVNCEIGENNIFNTGSIVEHECVIGCHNHISVASVLCGRVKIGNRCFIGAGAVVIDKVTICDNVIIGANSVVLRDILSPGVYVGNPVRKVK